jgi:putative hydrolase of the HAD superfamily
MSLRGLVFDIDDTLYLEREYVRSGFETVAVWVKTELGTPGFFDAAWAAFERGVRRTIFNEALCTLGLPAEGHHVNALVRVYRNHTPNISLLADAQACLERLHGSGLRLACVTDGPLTSQRAKATALGLERWLAPIVFTAELGKDFQKPDPRSFQKVAEALGVGGDALVYVADNPYKDFRGPKRLGWRTLRVRRPGSLHESIDSGRDVELEVTSLEGLEVALGLAKAVA